MKQEVKNKLIDYIEAYHTKTGEFPPRNKIEMAGGIISFDEAITPQEWDEFLEGEDTARSLDERGIIPPWKLETNAVGLTREQISVVAALNNLNDRRSDEKKLRDLGISPLKYAGWMHSNRFASYARESANNILAHSEHEAHKSLLHSMKQGNVNATKLYFEMTGRWNPANENSVNVQAVMQQVVEIIQKHVTEPELLMAIAADFQMLAASVNMSNGPTNTIIPGERVDVLQLEEKKTERREFKSPRGALYI